MERSCSFAVQGKRESEREGGVGIARDGTLADDGKRMEFTEWSGTFT